MTSEQFQSFYEEYSPKIKEVVKNSPNPIYMSEIMDEIAPKLRFADGFERYRDREKLRDELRSLLWTMVGPKWLHDDQPELFLTDSLAVVLWEDRNER